MNSMFEKPKRKRKNDELNLKLALVGGLVVLLLAGFGVYLLSDTPPTTPDATPAAPITDYMQQSVIEAAANIIVDQRPAGCQRGEKRVGDTYCTIQAGIDMAQSSDIVLVRGGVYPENVIIRKAITLWGDSAMPVIDPVEGITLQILDSEYPNITVKIGNFVLRGHVAGMEVHPAYTTTDLTVHRVIFQLAGDGIRIEGKTPNSDTTAAAVTIAITDQTTFQAMGTAIKVTNGENIRIVLDNQVTIQTPQIAVHVVGGKKHQIILQSATIQAAHTGYWIQNGEYHKLTSSSDTMLHGMGTIAYISGGEGNHIYLRNPVLQGGALLAEDSPGSKIHFGE
jgi:hypothetical protein